MSAEKRVLILWMAFQDAVLLTKQHDETVYDVELAKLFALADRLSYAGSGLTSEPFRSVMISMS